jgi:hypothetical protein
MISDNIDFKPDFKYVNVLLFTDKPLPVLLPYIYKESGVNCLSEWKFINFDQKESRHSVSEFHDM